jgi:hypothetical protein
VIRHVLNTGRTDPHQLAVLADGITTLQNVTLTS